MPQYRSRDAHSRSHGRRCCLSRALLSPQAQRHPALTNWTFWAASRCPQRDAVRPAHPCEPMDAAQIRPLLLITSSTARPLL
jgi:hypothetical protein